MEFFFKIDHTIWIALYPLQDIKQLVQCPIMNLLRFELDNLTMITRPNPVGDYEKWERYLSLKLLFETRKLTCALTSSIRLFISQQQSESALRLVGFR